MKINEMLFLSAFFLFFSSLSHIKIKENILQHDTRQNLVLIILLSENVTSRNVRSVENFFPISEISARYDTRKGIIFILRRGRHARKIARRMSVSKQINNKVNESYVDKPATRHRSRIHRRKSKENSYFTYLEMLMYLACLFWKVKYFSAYYCWIMIQYWVVRLIGISSWI